MATVRWLMQAGNDNAEAGYKLVVRWLMPIERRYRWDVRINFLLSAEGFAKPTESALPAFCHLLPEALAFKYSGAGAA